MTAQHSPCAEVMHNRLKADKKIQEKKQKEDEMEHRHGTTSNTDGVFSTFIGCTVKGILHEGGGETRDATILVFECGWGLAFNYNSSHWTVSPDEVQKILNHSRERLEDARKELEHILALAGDNKQK